MVPVVQQLTAQLQQAHQALATAASAALTTAANKLLGSYSQLLTLVGATAELDILAGFAAATADDAGAPGCCYCRPQFTAAPLQPAAAANACLGWNHTGGSEVWRGDAAALPLGGGRGLGASPALHMQGLWHPLLMQSNGAAAASASSGQQAFGSGAGVTPNDLCLGGQQQPGCLLLTGMGSSGLCLLTGRGSVCSRYGQHCRCIFPCGSPFFPF